MTYFWPNIIRLINAIYQSADNDPIANYVPSSANIQIDDIADVAGKGHLLFSCLAIFLAWVLGLGLLATRPPPHNECGWKKPKCLLSDYRTNCFPRNALTAPNAERIPRWNSSQCHSQKTMVIVFRTVCSELSRIFGIKFPPAQKSTRRKIFKTYWWERDSNEGGEKRLTARRVMLHKYAATLIRSVKFGRSLYPVLTTSAVAWVCFEHCVNILQILRKNQRILDKLVKKISVYHH